MTVSRLSNECSEEVAYLLRMSFDTYSISDFLNCHEHEVYNLIAGYGSMK